MTRHLKFFFENLNALLSAQAALVRTHQGAVVKYTGDGMMAIFRGMGRSYLALRCGLAIADLNGKHPFPFGIGIAQGLVLAGLIGDSTEAGQRDRKSTRLNSSHVLRSRMPSSA